MNAPRRAEGGFSLLPNLEKVDRTNDVKLPTLTGRELEILRLSASGECSQFIADELFVSKRTVDFHFANIYRKWRVTSRLKALRVARENGLLVT